MTQLTVELAGGVRKTAALSRSAPVRLGAEAGLEIELAGAGVLPVHALVDWHAGAWRITASPSAGQIVVNGRSISAEPLPNGALLTLGDLQLRLTLEQAGRSEQTSAAVTEELDLAPVASLSQFQPGGPPSKPAERPRTAPVAGSDDDLGLASTAGLSPAQQPPAPEASSQPSSSVSAPQHHPPAAEEELGLADQAGLGATPAGKKETPKPAPGAQRPAVPAASAPQTDKPTSAASNPNSAKSPSSAASPPAGNPSPPGAAIPAAERAPAKSAPTGKVAPQTAPTAVESPSADDDLFGGLLMSGDWESASASGLVGDPLTGGIGSAQAAGLGTPGSAVSSTARPAAKTGRVRRTAGWLLAAAPLALVAGLAAFIVWNLPSADRQWELALTSYEAQDWSQAETRLRAFAQANPRHGRAAEARILAGLCRIQPWLDSGADWSRAAAQLDQATQEWGPLCWHPVAQAALVRIAPPIAQALATACRTLEAQQEPVALRAVLRDAQIAISIARRTVPDELLSTTELAEAERTVKAIQSRQRSADVSRDAIAALQGATGLGNVADLALMLSELQRETSPGEFAPDLVAAIDAFVTALPAQLVAGGPEDVPPALPAEPAPDLRLAYRRWSPSVAATGGGVTAIAAPSLRCVYGVESATGRLLWRRCVGGGATFQPAAPPGGAQAIRLVLNAALLRSEAVDVQSGAVVWAVPRNPLDPEPLLTETACILAGHDGLIDVRSLADGRSLGRLQLPQKVCAPPLAEPDGSAVWIAAECEFAYRIELAPLRCTHVAWLGHAAQGISLRPFMQAARVAFIENRPRGGGRLHVVGGTPPRVLQRLELPERVTATPVVWEQSTFLVGESGRSLSVRWRDDGRAPASLSQQDEQVYEHPIQVAATPLAAALGGERLQAFDAAAGGAVVGAELSLGLCRVDAIQPVETGGWIVALATDQAPRRLYLAHWSAQADACTWITELGLAAEALPPEEGGAWRVATMDGTLASLGAVPTEIGPQSDVQSSSVAALAATAPVAVRLFATGPQELVVATEGRPHTALLRNTAVAQMPAELFVRVGPAQAVGRDTAGRYWLGELGAAVHVFQSPAEHRGLGWLPGPSAAAAWSDCWPLANAQVQFLRTDGLLTTWEYDPESGPRCVAQSNLAGPVHASGAYAAQWLWLFHGQQATAVNLNDGQIVAERSVTEPLVWGPQRVGQRVLAVVRGGKLLSLVDDSEPEWEVYLPFGAPVVAAAEGPGDRLWLATSRGDLIALNALTGEATQESVRTSEAIRRLYWHADALWALTDDGAVVQFAPPEAGSHAAD